jgi:HK97 family phage major capsid protein
MNKRVALDQLSTHVDKKLDDLLPSLLEKTIEKVLSKHGSTGTGITVSHLQAPAIVRGAPNNVVAARSWELKPKDLGIAAARMLRAFAFARGDMQKAVHFVEKVYDDMLGDEIKRVLTAGDATAAGMLIIPEYAQEIIELLRSMTVVRAAGARTVDLSTGTLTIRRQTSGSTAAYVGESEDIGITEPAVGDLVLVAK